MHRNSQQRSSGAAGGSSTAPYLRGALLGLTLIQLYTALSSVTFSKPGGLWAAAGAGQTASGADGTGERLKCM